MSQPIRLLIVENHPMVRDGFVALLKEEPSLSIIGVASNGQEALNIAPTLQPDVVLMDLDMPVMGGIEATQRLRLLQPQSKVLILTMYDAAEYILQAMQAGAMGFASKDTKTSTLVKMILAIHGGIAVFPPIDVSVRSASLLTLREIEVLQRIAQGRRDKEIARDLAIEIRTVEKHKQNIREKLKLKTAADLTSFAIKQQLI